MNTSRSAHATAAAAAASSRRSNHWKYEVFLSLGDDTRTTFTDHLSIALRDAGINTFVDYQLRREENTPSELDGEIEGSRIAVVVFSKRYAEAGCCLSELSKIMRCREDQEGKVVYPIFYDVDPSQVRKQSGSFGEAFRKHERDEDPDEVEQWRRDLKACADLCGRNLKTTADGREGLFIQNVVGDIIALTKTRDLQTSQSSTRLEYLVAWARVPTTVFFFF
nr:TMV resistance protein N-like [Malus domestica]